jgi:16S rRNA (guanine966-N2)-methyltransferase
MRVIAGIYKGRKLDAPPGLEVRPTPDKVKEAVFSMLASIAAPFGGEAPLAGRSCLDLFAGTGALGIEALSRGASSCVFVESSPAAAGTLAGNIARIVGPGEERMPGHSGYRRTEAGGDASAGRGAGPPARVLRADWRLALRRLSGGPRGGAGARFDVAFIDPPYEAGYYDEVMKTFFEYDIISGSGIVALERAAAGKDKSGGAGRRARGRADGVPITERPQRAEERAEERYEGFRLIRERRYGKTVIELYERTILTAAGEIPDAAEDRDLEGIAETQI